MNKERIIRRKKVETMKKNKERETLIKKEEKEINTKGERYGNRKTMKTDIDIL